MVYIYTRPTQHRTTSNTSKYLKG